MARSVLAGALQRLAAEYRAADALGLPVEQVQAMTPEEVREGLSRRDLLKGAAIVAGAVGLGQVPMSVPAARAAAAPRIAIVGAGISGLAAALRLQDSGLASTLYEANTRIGGRMFSNFTTWASGQVSEWGGELIDTGHKVIQDLAKRFNIGLDNLVQAEPSSAEPTCRSD